MSRKKNNQISQSEEQGLCVFQQAHLFLLPTVKQNTEYAWKVFSYHRRIGIYTLNLENKLGE